MKNKQTSLFTNWPSCLLKAYTRSPNHPLDLAFQHHHSPIMLLTLPWQQGKGRYSSVQAGPRGEQLTLVTNTLPVLQRHVVAWGGSRDDPLVHLQRDSGCSRGHLSARSRLLAISTGTKSSPLNYAWKPDKDGSITLTQPLHVARERATYTICVSLNI